MAGNPWDNAPIVAPASAGGGFALGGPTPSYQRDTAVLPYAAPTAAAGLASTQASEAHTVLENRRMQAQAPTDAAMAQANLTQAQANAVVAQQKADEAKANTALATMTPNSQLHGEAYLQKYVPPQMQAVVRAYARGDLGSRSGGLSTSMLPIIQHAMNFDPTTSATTFPARVKMQSDLAGNQPGTAGGSLRSMEQMLLHGSNVLSSGEALNNYGPGLLGSAANAIRTTYDGLTSDPTLNSYNQEVKNYAPESQKAVAGSAGVGQEREDRSAGYAASMPQASRAAALQADARMAFERMGAVNDQYKRLMGHDITDQLSPAAKAAYDKIMAGGYDEGGNPLYPAAGWTPISGPAAPTGAPPNSPLNGPPSSPPGSIPPGWTGSSSGPGMAIASGATRQVPLDHVNGIINNMVRSGASAQDIGKALEGTGFGTPSDEQIQAARNYLKANPGYKGSFGGLTATATNSALQQAAGSGAGAFLAGAGQGATAGLLPTVAGGVSALEGNGYAAGRDRFKVNQAMMQDAYPGPMLTGNILGGAASMGGLEAGAARAGLGKLAIPGAEAAYGGISGYNDGGVKGALEGAAIAPLAGMFGRSVLAPALRPITSPIGSAVRVISQPIADRLGIAARVAAPTSADATALRAASNAGIPAVQQSLTEASQLGVPMALADTNAGLRSLAGAAVRRSPDAAQLAEGALLPRARGQIDRFGSAVTRDLGPAANIPQTSADLTAQARTAAAPLYNAAYSAPGASSVDLSDLAQRPSMQAGLKRAYGIAKEEGRDPTSLGFDLNDQGDVTLNKVPSFQTLDYVKRGIDDTLEPHRNPITGKLALNEATSAINKTKADLLGRVDAVNPDYAAARSAYAGPVQARDALSRGQDAFSLSPDELGMQVGTQSPEHLAQMQLGYRSELMNRANTVRDTQNPFEAALGSPASRSRIDTLYPGNPGNANLFRQRDLEQGLARTNTDVIGGSQTAGRAQADKAFEGGPLPSLALDAALAAHGGVPVATVARSLGGSQIGDALKLGLGKRAEQKATALAPILLNTDPAASLSTLNGLVSKDAAYRDYINGLLSRRLSGMFGSSLGAAALTSQK